jgi:hypothetical protein
MSFYEIFKKNELNDGKMKMKEIIPQIKSRHISQ